MTFKKIAGPIRRVSGTNSADVEAALLPRAVGRLAKLAQYTVLVHSAPGTAPKIGFKLRHGPDGVASKEIVNSATVAVPADNLGMYDSGATVLNNYLHPIPVVGGSATGDSVTISVFEMLKPF